MEFPIGKKLSHLVVNPDTSRCPTDFLAVDLGLVQTTRNGETCKWNTKFRSENPTGKTGPPI